MKESLKKLNEKITVKRLVSFIALLAAFNFCLIINGEFRRAAAVADLKTSYQLSRSMLNSRAEIQIILINANLENRPLSPVEIDRIKQLWEKAEYNQVEK